MPPWLKRAKKYDPPQVEAENVYALEGTERGRLVAVLGPGPSISDFPLEKLEGVATIGVNSLLEVYRPNFFLFQEGFFAKRYRHLYTPAGRPDIVTTWPRRFISCLLPAGKRLFCYDYLAHSVLRMEKGWQAPYWLDPIRGFLPGRCSVAANAISLGVLMAAARILLVGIDLVSSPKGEYYVEGVRVNPGPRNRAKALGAGAAWMNLAARAGAWKGPIMYTTSPWLRLRGAKRISVDQAVSMVEEN